MKYPEGTIRLPLILGMDASGKIRWYIDAAFAVHNGMKSHTGAMMTMGQGAALCTIEQKKAEHEKFYRVRICGNR